MRGVYQAVAAEAGAAAAAAPATVGAGAQTASGGDDGGDGVGVVESGGIGFAVGTAPAGARPVASEGGGLLSMPPVMTMAGTPRGQRGSMGGMASAAASQAAEYGFGGGDPGSPGAPQPGPGLPGSTLSMPERRAAFSRFNKDIEAGRSLATVVSDRTAHMADLKRRIKDSSSRVNTAKAEIDGMSAQLAQSTQGAPAAGTGDVLDAERHSIMAQLKAAKSKYRAAFDEFKELRDELDPSTQGVAEAKQILIDEFNRWVETPNAGAAVEPTDKDELDAAEAFERMQVSRMTANDPDSVSYHTAVRKAGAAPGALTGAAGTARFGGVKAKGEATRRREAEQAIAAGTARV
ncbi:hypothetical protein FOA52_001116 [Chlamydomonas sp. UWO 241]|nr:hypothetical protein FOA52_001116 [Chlamydomonas sp. UWO 241]